MDYLYFTYDPDFVSQKHSTTVINQSNFQRTPTPPSQDGLVTSEYFRKSNETLQKQNSSQPVEPHKSTRIGEEVFSYDPDFLTQKQPTRVKNESTVLLNPTPPSQRKLVASKYFRKSNNNVQKYNQLQRKSIRKATQFVIKKHKGISENAHSKKRTMKIAQPSLLKLSHLQLDDEANDYADYCPFCGKKLKAELQDAHHIKTCGKKTHASTIIAAVELQKKHVKQFNSLGLIFPGYPTEPKKTPNYLRDTSPRKLVSSETKAMVRTKPNVAKSQLFTTSLEAKKKILSQRILEITGRPRLAHGTDGDAPNIEKTSQTISEQDSKASKRPITSDPRNSSPSEETTETWDGMTFHFHRNCSPVVRAVVRMLTSGQRIDFQLQAKGGIQIKCHKFMMESRCKKLLDAANLSNLDKGHQVYSLDLTNFTPEAVRHFVWFLYTGIIDRNVHSEIAVEVQALIKSWVDTDA